MNKFQEKSKEFFWTKKAANFWCGAVVSWGKFKKQEWSCQSSVAGTNRLKMNPVETKGYFIWRIRFFRCINSPDLHQLELEESRHHTTVRLAKACETSGLRWFRDMPELFNGLLLFKQMFVVSPHVLAVVGAVQTYSEQTAVQLPAARQTCFGACLIHWWDSSLCFTSRIFFAGGGGVCVKIYLIDIAVVWNLTVGYL